MTIRLDAPQYKPSGPDGKGWNRLSLNAHIGTSIAPQCALKPRSHPQLWESQNTERARWGGWGACTRPDGGHCGGCPVLELRTELRSFTPSVLVRLKLRHDASSGLLSQSWHEPWVMNRPDDGWGEYGMPWTWSDLAALAGWRVESRRYVDRHGEGFWLHATRRSCVSGAYIYGFGDEVIS